MQGDGVNGQNRVPLVGNLWPLELPFQASSQLVDLLRQNMWKQKTNVMLSHWPGLRICLGSTIAIQC